MATASSSATAISSPTPSTGSTFIRQAQAAGLTLAQIGQILAIRDDGQAPCAHTAQLIDQQLEGVERRLTELEAAREQLRQLAERARRLDPEDCTDFCHIIQCDGPDTP